MPACFSELIHCARAELVVTTPYFVPDEQLLFALTSAGRRGVRTTMLFPKRNDNWIVAAASRSYYKDLIDAGAEIYEFRPGLLHAKTIVADGRVGLIGSANLDRRSFELNFENNVLFEDAAFAAAVRRGRTNISPNATASLARTSPVRHRPRLWQNLLATLSPMLSADDFFRLEEEVDLDRSHSRRCPSRGPNWLRSIPHRLCGSCRRRHWPGWSRP